MNLVKAQAIANDLSPQALKKYADGFDPRIIPPWLATGTLQAKIDSKNRLDNMMAQGETTSVKEQIEQKAGLMAAQAMKQQAQQQPQQASLMGPVPGNIPQPSAQPKEMMMARGGLASVPVNFSFAPGGIVGYQSGGDIDAAREQAVKALSVLRQYKDSFTMRQTDPEGFQAAEAEAEAATLRLEAATKGEPAGVLGRSMNTPAEPLPQKVPYSVSEAQATSKAGPQAAVPPKTQERVIPKVKPTAPPIEKPLSGLPAAAAVSPFIQEAATQARIQPVAPTPESIIAEQTALSPAAMQEAAMKKRYDDQIARADQEKAVYEKSRPSGLDDLIQMFGQAGQYKGLSGTGPAYTAMQQQKRADDVGFERRQNELRTAADVKNYEGAKELFATRAGALKEDKKSYNDRLISNARVFADLSGVDQRRIDEALRNLNQMEIQKLQASTQNRSENDKVKFQADFLAAKAKARELASNGDASGAAKFEAIASDMLASRGLGGAGSGTAAVGADNAQTRKLRDAVKEIDSRLESLDPKTPEAKKLQLDRDRLSKLIVQRAIGEAGADSGAPVASLADVAATAKSSGKTEQQVIKDLKARGYQII